jgi:hypothetical protein
MHDAFCRHYLLEVIHEAPYEVAAHVHAGLARPLHLRDIARQVLNPVIMQRQRQGCFNAQIDTPLRDEAYSPELIVQSLCDWQLGLSRSVGSVLRHVDG